MVRHWFLCLYLTFLAFGGQTGVQADDHDKLVCHHKFNNFDLLEESESATSTTPLPKFFTASYSLLMHKVNSSFVSMGSIQQHHINESAHVVLAKEADGKVHAYAFDGEDVFRVDDKYACSYFNYSDSGSLNTSPLLLDVSKLSAFTDNIWRDISDLFTFADGSPQSWVHQTIPGQAMYSWYGCFQNNNTNQSYLQVSVLYNNATNNFVPLGVNLYVYTVDDEKNETTTEYEARFALSMVDQLDDSADFSNVVAPGVFCTDAPNVTLPDFGSSVRSHVKYFSTTGNEVQKFNLLIDHVNGSGMFVFDYMKQVDAPFYADYGKQADVRVIHDFKYGVQYLVKSTDKTCVGDPVPIPDTAADMNDKALKSVAELLVGSLSGSAVHKKTQHWSSRSYDVYVFRRDVNTTVELHVGSPDLSVHDGTTGISGKPVLLSVHVYHWVGQGQDTVNKKLLSHTMIDYDVPLVVDNEEVVWHKYDVTPCLKTIAYYQVDIGKASMSSIETNGLQRTINSVVSQLAEHANVSALRISTKNLYFYQNGTELSLFFTIAERPRADIAGFAQQVSLAEAVQNLNDTLADGDLVVTVSSTFSLTVLKDSLNAVTEHGGQPLPPPTPCPKPESGGASGGAMFVLAFCMLCVGALCGIAGAWWMWKRNRGIAYQVYE